MVGYLPSVERRTTKPPLLREKVSGEPVIVTVWIFSDTNDWVDIVPHTKYSERVEFEDAARAGDPASAGLDTTAALCRFCTSSIT